jgi:hypothetical protein
MARTIPHSAGIVEIAVEPAVVGLGCVVAGNDAERTGDAGKQHDGAMNAQRVAAPGNRHRESK